jgi:P pilus assembly chaperone PapD
MRSLTTGGIFLLAALFLPTSPASADITVSRVVVDIGPNMDAAQDIEITNNGDEIAYVVIEPSEILSPGTPAEKRQPIVDPEVGGLLVSPQRVILQPGEHKVVRIAAIAARGETDRIYRITVKPVAGPVTAKVTALKLLVGYDALVIYRPAAPTGKVVGERHGTVLSLRNDGNTNVELFEGKQCDAGASTGCVELPSKRLYAGQSWQQTLSGAGPVNYRVAVGTTSSLHQY